MPAGRTPCAQHGEKANADEECATEGSRVYHLDDVAEHWLVCDRCKTYPRERKVTVACEWKTSACALGAGPIYTRPRPKRGGAVVVGWRGHWLRPQRASTARPTSNSGSPLAPLPSKCCMTWFSMAAIKQGAQRWSWRAGQVKSGGKRSRRCVRWPNTAGPRLWKH